jgi:hypothetical protein
MYHLPLTLEALFSCVLIRFSPSITFIFKGAHKYITDWGVAETLLFLTLDYCSIKSYTSSTQHVSATGSRHVLLFIIHSDGVSKLRILIRR